MTVGCRRKIRDASLLPRSQTADACLPTSTSPVRDELRSDAHADADAFDPLPLPKDFFRPLTLAPSSTRTYDELSAAMLEHALTRAHRVRIYGGVDDSWNDLGVEHGFQRHIKTEGGWEHFRVQGVVQAPTHAIMSLLHCDGDRAVMQRREHIHGHALDAQTLAVLRDDPDVHTSIRWEAFALPDTPCSTSLAAALSASSSSSFASSSSSVMSKTKAKLTKSKSTGPIQCDAVLLQSTGVKMDHSGQPTGFVLSQTVNLPTCRSLAASHGLTRIAVMESMLLSPAQMPRTTEIILEGFMELPASISTNVVAALTSAIALRLLRLPQVLRAQQLATLRVLDRRLWVRKSARRNCSACLSKFGLLSRKHHCRCCGDVICRSCVILRPDAADIKFCAPCADTVSMLPSESRYCGLHATRASAGISLSATLPMPRHPRCEGIDTASTSGPFRMGALQQSYVGRLAASHEDGQAIAHRQRQQSAREWLAHMQRKHDDAMDEYATTGHTGRRWHTERPPPREFHTTSAGWTKTRFCADARVFQTFTTV